MLESNASININGHLKLCISGRLSSKLGFKSIPGFTEQSQVAAVSLNKVQVNCNPAGEQSA